MPKFLIEREIPGAGKLSADELKGIAERSNAVIKELNEQGHPIQWVQSFVSADRITCVYNAPDEQTLRDHAVRGPFPANAITQVSEVIDPITGEGRSS
ncbi:MAG: DUF4242 domain-containing protein [Gemmatimonadaceae bacterium]|nr:DUF4242 domain-containing protein [Gemmatimonadaceae bacterium]